MLSPLRDNLLIRADKKDDKTKSGFLLVDEWNTLPHTGEVLAIGPQVTQVAVGERVRFNRYAFEKVGTDELIGLERNVTAKIDG